MVPEGAFKLSWQWIGILFASVVVVAGILWFVWRDPHQRVGSSVAVVGVGMLIFFVAQNC